MALLLLTGGARSGKSALAVDLARSYPGPVVVLATARAEDAEMAARIAAHRAARPAGWVVVEESLALAEAIAGVAAGTCLLIDCLTLWVANAMEAGLPDLPGRAREAAALAAARVAPTIAVANEVGMGLVPMHPVGRAFRDEAGRVNAAWAAAADEAALVVAGRALPLPAGPVTLGGLTARGT